MNRMRLFVLAGLVLLVPDLAVKAEPAARTAAPFPTLLRTKLPVVALGSSATEVAVATAAADDSSHRLLVWSIGRRVTRMTASEAEPDEDSGSYGDIAVTELGEVLWSVGVQHNSQYGDVYVGRASQPNTAEALYSAVDEDLPVSLDADGEVVAFSTQPPFTMGRTLLWVGNTRGVVPIHKAFGAIDDVAVQGGLVAKAYRDGRVEVFRASGRRARYFPAGTATRGIELDSGQLIAVTETTVAVRSIETGETVFSRRLRRPGSLLDSGAGLVAYRADSGVRLLRVFDGRDVRVPGTRAPKKCRQCETVHARFVTGGLVVSHDRVVELRTTNALERLLAAAPRK
jgi:hypothetical protein